MTQPRDLDWPDCWNIRDLGGLPLTSGGTTQFGRVVRGDHPGKLTAAGWQALQDYGIRTIITLYTHGLPPTDEDKQEIPAGLQHTSVAIEDYTDIEFVETYARTGLWGTPLYYAPALRRWPQRSAAVIQAIARAVPGGLLFHCAAGRDRTGLAALLLLSITGVTMEAIVDDFAHSYRRMTRPEQQKELGMIEALLQQHNTTGEQVIRELLDKIDVPTYLRGAGVTREELRAAASLLKA